MRRPLRLGVVGPGIAFQQLHLPELRARRDELELSWLSGTSLDRTGRAADAVSAAGFDRPAIGTDAAALLSEQPVDAVLVAVPIARTAAVVRRVLDAGAHVLAEKPLAEYVDQARALVESAAAGGQVLLVGENFRYQRRFTAVRQLIAAGAIGEPKLFFLNDLHFTPADATYAKTSWRRAGAHRGGYLLDGGSHVVAGMRCMVGRKVEAVHAVATAVHPGPLGSQPDALLVNLTFEGGLVGHLAMGNATVETGSRVPRVYGTGGTLALTGKGIELWSAGGNEDRVLEQVDKRDTGFDVEWRLFLAALHGDPDARSEAHVDAMEAVEDLRVLEAALDSARSGQVERLA